MMFYSRFVKCECDSELQQRHRTEPLPVQKTRPESIVKQTTLMPLNYSRTYEGLMKLSQNLIDNARSTIESNLHQSRRDLCQSSIKIKV